MQGLIFTGMIAEGYRVVILFLDVTNPVTVYDFKLVQIVMIVYISNTVGVICHLCMRYIDLPGLYLRSYIFYLLRDIKNIMLLRNLFDTFRMNAISLIFIFEID